MGIERVLPLRFILVPQTAGSAPATLAQIQGAVQTANEAFRGAGVQFSIRSVESYVLPALFPADDPMAVPWGDFNTPGTVANQLASVFPSLPFLANNPPPGELARKDTWMFYAATRGAASQDLVVWITTSGGTAGGATPWDGRAVLGGAWLLDDRWKFAHELGHVMGLSHPQIANGGLACKPGATVDCDGSSVGMTTMADHWDMVYRPGTSAANPHKTFSNRAEAADAGVGNLQWIDDGLPDGMGNRCAVSWTSPGGVVCTMPGQPGSGYSETWSNFLTPTKVRGYSWSTAEVRRGSTVMPYRFIPPASAPDWPAGFSDSEADLIRGNLRYDMKIANGSYLQAAGATGGRPLLGRALRRRPAEMLDFDGDGARDLAVWEPPVNTLPPGWPPPLGRFRVFTSSSNFTAQITMQHGELGDIPVPADYNGDGVTDYAVVHDGGTTASNSGTMFWRACASACPVGDPYPCAATHSCGAPTNIQWGDRADVPMPGTRFDPSATGEMTVYRPSDGNVYVLNPSTWGQTTISTGWGAYNDQAPFVGNFDSHPGSDVAVYDPRQGEFRLRLSSSGWTTPILRSFCPAGPSSCAFVPKGTGTSADKAGALPIWGLQSGVGSPSAAWWGALALWDPSNGNWNVMWTPATSSAIETHQWGVSSDVLVGDAVGLTAAPLAGQRSHLVAFRSDTTSGPGVFYRCAFPPGAGACPGGAAQAITVPGGQRRTEAFAVANMVPNGDGKPELCAFSPEVGTIRCYTSDSGYATAIVVTFPNHGAQFL